MKHYITKNRYFLIGIAIVLLAVFLRIFQLSALPAGLSVDEAASGYNAFAIATQHRDEWLVKMPISFKSFGEHKPAVSIYIIAVLIKIFGMSEFWIRFPAAMAGVFTTISAFFLAYKLFPSKPAYALTVMALVAVSPLNIQFSRIAFESSMGVATLLIGATFFIWAKDQIGLKKVVFYAVAGITWALAFHSNQATKLVLPFVILTLLWEQRSTIRKNLKELCICLFLAGVGVLVLLYQLKTTGGGLERLAMTSAFIDETGTKPVTEIVQVTFVNTVKHLNPEFLIFGNTDNYRHGNGVFGILSFVEGFLFLIGLYFIIRKPSLRKSYGWLMVLFFIGLIPGIIGIPAPHANRVHHIIPWVQLIAGIGFFQIIENVKSNRKETVWRICIGLLTLQLIWQVSQYRHIYSVVAASDFQYGYKQAIAYTTQHESEVTEIFMTDHYDQPYIYTLLYKRILPIDYHHGALIKYRFQTIDFEQLSSKKDILIVAAPSEVPDSTTLQPIHTVLYPDGSTAFLIFLLK